MNLAIFGGSFDPPHIAHQEIINKLDKLKWLDKVIVLPAYQSLFKQTSLFSPECRLKCLDIMTQQCHKSIISPYEIHSQKSLPTIESVLHFKEIYAPDKIFLAIGADILPTLHQWQRFAHLRKEVEFIIITRDNILIPPHYKTLKINIKCSSSFIKENLKNPSVSKKKIVESWIPFSIQNEIKKELTNKGYLWN